MSGMEVSSVFSSLVNVTLTLYFVDGISSDIEYDDIKTAHQLDSSSTSLIKEKCFAHDCIHESKHWFKCLDKNNNVPLLQVCSYHFMVYTNKITHFRELYEEISHDQFIAIKVISE